MTRTSGRSHPEAINTVTLTEVSRAIGQPRMKTRRLMTRTGLWQSFYRFVPGCSARFDPRVIDVLHAVLGQPHRSLEKPDADWLSQWLQSGGDAHAP